VYISGEFSAFDKKIDIHAKRQGEREILSIAQFNNSPHPSRYGPDVGDKKKLH
jgi:hypothetical protein